MRCLWCHVPITQPVVCDRCVTDDLRSNLLMYHREQTPIVFRPGPGGWWSLHGIRMMRVWPGKLGRMRGIDMLGQRWKGRRDLTTAGAAFMLPGRQTAQLPASAVGRGTNIWMTALLHGVELNWRMEITDAEYGTEATTLYGKRPTGEVASITLDHDDMVGIADYQLA